MRRQWFGAVCVTLLSCAKATSTLPARSQTTVAAPQATGPSQAAAVSKELPLVVVVRADWCPTCRRIEPTVTALTQEYAGRASFLFLDVTDDASTARATSLAESAGVGEFFRDNHATGIVAIFTRSRARVAQLAGETDAARYREPLTRAFAAN